MSRLQRLGAVAAVLTVVSGIAAGSGAVWGEVGTVEAINDVPGPVIAALELVMQLGARPAIVLVAVVAVVIVDADWKRVLAAVVLSGAVAWAGATVAKDVVERPRPPAYSDQIELHDDPDGFGWPSSHVAVAAGSLTAAALVARRRPSAAIVLAGVVGLGRMAVGVHLPLDVVGGLGIGVTTAVVAVAVIGR